MRAWLLERYGDPATAGWIDEHGDLFASVLEDPRPLAPAQRAVDALYD